MKTTTKLWLGLTILALLSPLGLWLPKWFNAGAAWGEWDAATVKSMTGHMPTGLQGLENFWRALLPDYAFRGDPNSKWGHLTIAYLLSALIGMGIIIGLSFLLTHRILRKKKDSV